MERDKLPQLNLKAFPESLLRFLRERRIELATAISNALENIEATPKEVQPPTEIMAPRFQRMNPKSLTQKRPFRR